MENTLLMSIMNAIETYYITSYNQGKIPDMDLGHMIRDRVTNFLGKKFKEIAVKPVDEISLLDLWKSIVNE